METEQKSKHQRYGNYCSFCGTTGCSEEGTAQAVVTAPPVPEEGAEGIGLTTSEYVGS